MSLTIIGHLVGKEQPYLVSFHGQGADGVTKAHVYHDHYHESDMKGVVVVVMGKALSYLGIQRGTRGAALVSACLFAVGLDLDCYY